MRCEVRGCEAAQQAFSVATYVVMHEALWMLFAIFECSYFQMLMSPQRYSSGRSEVDNSCA